MSFFLQQYNLLLDYTQRCPKNIYYMQCFFRGFIIHNVVLSKKKLYTMLSEKYKSINI